METTTRVGIAVMCLSLTTGAGGVGLITFAHGIPAPHEPAPRTLTGTVTSIVTEGCGYTNRRTTCYRPVVDYSDINGRPNQLVSRTAYRTSSPLKQGERVTVYVETAGAVWLAMEWDARQAKASAGIRRQARLPADDGPHPDGCCAFALLLGTDLICWVDRSGDTP